jgi:glycosyltransferase involved in cell wall biosynthesis
LSAQALLPSSALANESAEHDRRVGEKRQPVIWFEVEDFLRYFDHFRNPTGLQRMPFEIYLEAERLYGGARVRFCRLSVYTKQLRVIGFDVVRAVYLDPPGAGAPWKTIWAPANFWNELPVMLSTMLRHPLFFLSMVMAAARDVLGAFRRRTRFERFAHPGDIVVVLGAAWGIPRYMQHIAAAKRRYGLRFAVLIHDLIPIEFESLVEPWHVVQFRSWLQQAIAAAEVVFTTSRYSRDALVAAAGSAGWRLPRAEVIQPGSGFNDRLMAGSQRAPRFPARYVLFVSTIEIRKNHRLLVAVWRRLIERHGADAVPSLVFAGQIGWMVDDLLAELAASGYLGGKIVLLPDLSDVELREAYRLCLFTVFPSLCEGWGLPVAESLAHGKFCVASNRTSIPEICGDLIDYFDPANEEEALAKIERVLFDPDYRTAREARLRAEYRPRSWVDCVHTLIDALGCRLSAAQTSEAQAAAPLSDTGV